MDMSVSHDVVICFHWEAADHYLNMASGLFQEFQCHSRRFPCVSPSWVSAAIKYKSKAVGNWFAASGSTPDLQSFPLSPITKKMTAHPESHCKSRGGNATSSTWAGQHTRTPSVSQSLSVVQKRLRFSWLKRVELQTIFLFCSLRFQAAESVGTGHTWQLERFGFYWEVVCMDDGLHTFMTINREKRFYCWRDSWTNMAVLWSHCPKYSTRINHKQAKQIKRIYFPCIYWRIGMVYEHKLKMYTHGCVPLQISHVRKAAAASVNYWKSLLSHLHKDWVSSFQWELRVHLLHFQVICLSHAFKCKTSETV